MEAELSSGPAVQDSRNLDSKAIGRSTRAAVFCVAIGALGGCGPGSDPPTDLNVRPPPIVAGADTLSIARGQSSNLLVNDTLGGEAASTGAAGNVSFTLTSGTLPVGVAIADGILAVAGTAAPGVFTVTYTICEVASSTNCASATAQITVPVPSIVAVADTFNLAAGGSGDVLANDTLGGTAASAGTVVVGTTTTLPMGIALSTGGVISVAATAAVGVHPIGYQICQSGVPTNCASTTATVTVPAATVVTGRAIDSATGAGVAGVTVTAGAATASTDANGNFSLPNAPVGDRVTVLFGSTSYAESARVAAVGSTGLTDVQVRLVRVAATVLLDVSAGGIATVPGSTARIVISANSVQRADGTVPTGSMSVALTPLNAASDSAVMPGDFTTIAAGAVAPIESFGALNVRLFDSGGNVLFLRSGQTASVRIPMASRSGTVPATIPLFFFDNATGRWVQEGVATLVGTGANAYYEGTVTRFITWNADQIYNTVRLTGCVTTSVGARVAGAQVVSDGVDYSGVTSSVTDANGGFSIPIRRASSATLLGLSAGHLTNTLRVGPYAVDTTLAGCLALGQAGAGVTMKLTWGALPRDLDSHLFTPSGAHLYFASKGNLLAAPFANLDVDDTSSFGPEVVTLTRLMVGTYKYSINNFSQFFAGPITQASSRVELNIPGRASELLVPPAGETSATNWWNLLEFDVDSTCDVTVRRIGTFTTAPPLAATQSVPVYCTAP